MVNLPSLSTFFLNLKYKNISGNLEILSLSRNRIKRIAGLEEVG